jgi:hypothetical protein
VSSTPSPGSTNPGASRELPTSSKESTSAQSASIPPVSTPIPTTLNVYRTVSSISGHGPGATTPGAVQLEEGAPISRSSADGPSTRSAHKRKTSTTSQPASAVTKRSRRGLPVAIESHSCGTGAEASRAQPGGIRNQDPEHIVIRKKSDEKLIRVLRLPLSASLPSASASANLGWSEEDEALILWVSITLAFNVPSLNCLPSLVI